MASEDPWEAARRRTREEVSEIFTRHAKAPPLRACPHCGHEARTPHEHCPACERSYFARPARLSRRTRRALLAGSGLLAALAAAFVVHALANQARDNKADTRARQAAAVAAERRRLEREQRPHHGRAAALRDGGAHASTAARLHNRRALVGRLESSITADARARVAHHEIQASAIVNTTCHPLANNAPRDELELDKTLGRYACEAAVQTARNAGVTSTLGVPFVGTVNFSSGRMTWCKDNPTSASDVKQARFRAPGPRMHRRTRPRLRVRLPHRTTPLNPVVATATGAEETACVTADVLFSLQAVTLTRAGRRVLEHVTLEIGEGATAVVGPSGAGKSTLLRLLNRLADPDEGTIRFRGRDLRDYDALKLRQTVALVPQLPALLDGSPRTNIAFAASLAGRDSDVAAVLVRAGLDPAFADREVRRLSVGEQQRVMLSRALAQEPSVLLLDEPTSALDETSRDAIEQTLGRLRDTLGISLLLVTHDRAQAERLAQRTIQIDRGHIVPTPPQATTPTRRA